MEKILVERTKRGFPAYWEQGGGYTNTGEATIISNKDGQPKKAIYVRGRGELANSQHALFILEIGDYIIKTNHHRGDYETEILKVLGFENKEEDTYAIVEQTNYFSNGEWDVELPAFLEVAVQAAMKKADCYHCRGSHFIAE